MNPETGAKALSSVNSFCVCVCVHFSFSAYSEWNCGLLPSFFNHRRLHQLSSLTPTQILQNVIISLGLKNILLVCDLVLLVFAIIAFDKRFRVL